MVSIYLAGPMRGIPLFNFPMFDKAAALLRAHGFAVYNPAEMDRAAGFNPTRDEATPAFIRQAVIRDAWAITQCQSLLLLPGWENSRGVAWEKPLAEFLGLEICRWEQTTPEPITAEAQRITSQDRRDVYGHPLEDFTRIGQLWAPLLGVEEITAEQVAHCMIALKLGRLTHAPGHRDSLVDIAGYANCADYIRQAREVAG